MAKEKDLSKDIKDLKKKLDTLANQKTKEKTDEIDISLDRAQNLLKVLQAQNAAVDERKSLEKQLADLQEEYTKGAERFGDELFEQNKTTQLVIKAQLKQLDNLEVQLSAQKNIYNQSDLQYKKRKQLLQLEEKYQSKVEESLEFLDDIKHSIEKIPVIGGVLSKALGVDQVKEKLTDLATKDLANVAMSAKSGFKGMGSAIGKTLPLVLALGAAFALIEFAIDIDKETTELARNLGKSKDEAHDLHVEMVATANASDNALETVHNLTKATTDLAAAAGTNLIITKDLQENQILLANNLGVTAEAAAKLNTAMATTGKPAKELTADIINTVDQFNAATGAGFNLRESIEEVGNVSSKVRAQFKGNYKELTLQVLKAKQLGLTLDKIYAIGRQSLDVETSIGQEMEARVLTGKNINLTAFRAAALTHNQSKMQSELVKNVGSLNDFTNLNVVAQESLSETFGMSVDEMTDMLKQQKLLTELGATSLDNVSEQEIRNSTLSKSDQDRIIAQKQMSDYSDKMAKTMDSLKQIFSGMASALQPVLDMFASILKHTTAIKVIMYTVGAYMAINWIKSLGMAANAFLGIGATQKANLITESAITAEKTAQTLETEVQLPLEESKLVVKAGQSAEELVQTGLKGDQLLLDESSLAVGAEKLTVAAMTAAASVVKFVADTMGLGAFAVPAIIAAGAATAAGIYSLVSTGDLGLDPNGGPAVISPRENAIFQGTKNDEVAMAPGVLGALSSSQSSTGNTVVASAGTDTSRLESLLEKLIAKVDQPVNVNINGKVIDEIDTQTTLRKSYNTKVDRGYGTFG